MSFFQLLLIIIIITVVFWVFFMILRSVLKAISALMLGGFVLLVIFGSMFYMDIRSLEDKLIEDEGENILMVWDNQSIIMVSRIEPQGLMERNKVLEEIRLDDNKKQRIDNSSFTSNKSNIISIRKEAFQEGLSEIISYNGLNISKDDFLKVLDKDDELEIYKIIYSDYELDYYEENVDKFIEDDNFDNFKTMALTIAMENMIQDNGYTWLIKMYSRGHIKIEPEKFSLKVIKILPL